MKEGTKVYEDLGNGIVAIDAKEYNRPFVEMARLVYYAFLVTAIIIIALFVIFDAIPWITQHVNTSLCDAIPNWNWRDGVCP